MFDLGKLVFDQVFKLIIGVIDSKLKSSTLSYLDQRKIRRRVEDATAEVVESLVPFLEQEKISPDKQERLIETCIRELKPFTKNPSELFKGSLDGQKIFENLYHDKEFPQVIVEDGSKDIYSLFFPQIATLLCKIPAAVKDWENEAWSENYRRIDEVVAQLKNLITQVNDLANAPTKGADSTLIRLKQMLAQKVGLQLDITGLRADQPYSGKFDDFFVLPEIKQIANEGNKNPISVTESNDCFFSFTNSGCLSIIIGAPGAGKSTWSKWLQKETLQTNWTGIGIRIEFRELNVESLPSIYELIRNIAGKQLSEDLASEKIRKWLDNWQIAFILDGFDEVKPTDRIRFIEWINEISDFARGCPFVITSRPLTTHHLETLNDTWQQWTIESFDRQRIVKYISKWYDNSPLLADNDRKIDANKLATEWLDDSTIGRLTGNPLLLSTLLMVHHLDGKLPNGRANLYKRYVDGMLGIWDDRHKLIATDIQLSPGEKRKIIQGIALHLFLSEQETIDEHILTEWLKGYLPKVDIKATANDVLLILRERSGLIVGPGIYSFAHKTIAEFLVAETIIQGDQKDASNKRIDRFRLFEHRNDDRWNTVLFLWSGLAPFLDVEAFVDECIKESNWAVALGIMFDQYDRFALDSRRKILLNLISSASSIFNFKKDEVNSYWISNSRPEAITLDDSIPRSPFRIRNLHGEGYLDVAIQRSHDDGTIIWPDCLKAKNKLYNLLWFEFAVHPKNSDELELVLKSRFPARVKKLNYLFIVASWSTRLRNKYNINIEILAKLLIETFPETSSFMPMVIMSNVINMFLYDSASRSFYNMGDEQVKSITENMPEDEMRFIEQALITLIKLDVTKIGEDFLKWSSDWEFHHSMKLDLLEVFADLMKLSNETNKISSDITTQTLEYIKLLKNKRNIVTDKNSRPKQKVL